MSSISSQWEACCLQNARGLQMAVFFKYLQKGGLPGGGGLQWFHRDEHASSTELGGRGIEIKDNKLKTDNVLHLLPLKKWEMTTSLMMWPWPQRMVSWLKPTRWSWQAAVHKQTPPPSCLRWLNLKVSSTKKLIMEPPTPKSEILWRVGVRGKQFEIWGVRHP